MIMVPFILAKFVWSSKFLTIKPISIISKTSSLVQSHVLGESSGFVQTYWNNGGYAWLKLL